MRETFERFPGLQIFYGLCTVGLWGSSLSFIYLLWAMSPFRPTISIPLAILIAILMHWRLRRRGSRYVEKARLQEGGVLHGQRLKRKLHDLELQLCTFAGDTNTKLIFDPSSAVLLYTVTSRGTPIVAITAGFWQHYSERPELLEAALAHEAGHVAARDVEKFVFFQSWMVILLACSAFVMLWALLISYEQFSLLPALFPIISVVFGAAIALSWSSLIVARELEADVYAVDELGQQAPVRNLLLSQLEQRSARSDASGAFRRFRNWLIQPNLQWRAGLPGVAGLMGRRVILKLGLALAGFVATWLFALSMLAYNDRSDVSAQLPPLFLLLLYLTWYLYGFAWGRNRQFGGRSLESFLRSTLDFVTFVAPTVLLLAVIASIIARYQPGLMGTGEAVMQVIALVTCAWAASKIALLSPKERIVQRHSPSFFRALLSWVVLLISSGILHVLLSLFLPLPDLANGGLPLGSPLLALMPFLVGCIAHFLTPAGNQSSYPHHMPQGRARLIGKVEHGKAARTSGSGHS